MILLAKLAAVLFLGLTDVSGHALTQLWEQYDKVCSADKPKDKMAILESIKKEAAAKHFLWDWYDAGEKYVSAKASTDWKSMDAAQDRFDREVKALGEPLVIFYHRFMYEPSSDLDESLLKFVEENQARLKAGCNRQFYREDYVTRGGLLGAVLPDLLENDYDYAIWHVFLRRSGLVPDMASRYPYPLGAYAEYLEVSGSPSSKGRNAALKALAEKYDGKAIGLLPRQTILNEHFSQLKKEGASGLEYRELRQDCMKFLSDCKSFSGQEASIARCCDLVNSLVAIMDEARIEVNAEDAVAQLVLQNVPFVNLLMTRSGKTVFSCKVDNPVLSYYVRDTVNVALPSDIDDGDYTLLCSSSKKSGRSMADYERYTLSIAQRTDADGMAVYVADYKSGEPLSVCDLILLDNSRKELARENSVRLDGFTAVPASLKKIMSSKRFQGYIQASLSSGGHVRLSKACSIQMRTVGQDCSKVVDESLRMRIITDRTAFNPGETVHFKSVLYKEGSEAWEVLSGRWLKARLINPVGDIVASGEYETNEFGSIAGDFVLERCDRGGTYRLEVVADNGFCTEKNLLVGDFVLPTFTLAWDAFRKYWLVGETIRMSGRVSSYSGHPLSSATARYTFSRYGKILAEGTVALDAEGRFALAIPSPDIRYYCGYDVSVRLTDATGETLEFTEDVYVSPRPPLQLSLTNAAEGKCMLAGRWDKVPILTADEAKFTFFEEDFVHPGLQSRYRIIGDGKVLMENTVDACALVKIDVSTLPSGLYDLVVSTCDVEESFTFLRMHEDDNSLPSGIESYFLELQAGTGLAVGSSMGPVWALAELHGLGGACLDHRISRIERGSIARIKYEYRKSWPESLQLSVMWFRDSSWQEYDAYAFRKRSKDTLPLSFTRFHDSVEPASEYVFSVSTALDVECAATVFDVSTETLSPNVWTKVESTWGPGVPGIDYYLVSGSMSGHSGIIKRSIALKSSGAVEEDAIPYMMANSAAAYDEEETEEAVSNLNVREFFASTLAWEPQLRSGKDGNVEFKVPVSDKLSTYCVQVFAHDRSMLNAVLRREMVVTVPVEVAVVQPQYLYESDRYVARASLSSGGGEPVSGKASVLFFNGGDYKNTKPLSGNTVGLAVPAASVVPFNAEFTVPAGIDTLGVLVMFTPDDSKAAADAMFVKVPVLPAHQTLTEAHSAVLLPGTDRGALLAGLRSQFVNADGDAASLNEVSIRGMLGAAVPERIEPAGNNVLQLTEALHARALAAWMGMNPDGQLTSDEELFAKVNECRNSDGGYGWFAGMKSSPIVSAKVLERFKSIVLDPDGTMSVTVKYLDNAQFGEKPLPWWCGGLSLGQYLYVRALFPSVVFKQDGLQKKEIREFRKQVKAYLTPSGRRGLDGDVLAKARRAATLRELMSSADGQALAEEWGLKLPKMKKSLAADIESLLQYVEAHEGGGCYLPNAVMPFRGLLENEAYAHAMLCDLFKATGHQEVADGIRLWLMLQKETQAWADSPAYLEALSAVFDGSDELLETKVMALTAEFTKEFSGILASGNQMSVERRYFIGSKEIADGDTLHVGDRVRAEYRLWSLENRSFVRLSVPRPASMRPVEQVSGRWGSWIYQCYRSVLADRTEYWFESFPEEGSGVTEEFFVTQEGSFVAPAAELVSLYAPHYRANDVKIDYICD